MSDETGAGLALCQASEQIDGKIAEIESLLLTLLKTYRVAASPSMDLEAVTAELR